MAGRYLRTNYRLGGGELDVDAFGPAISMGSAGAGDGFPAKPYGGFVWMSYIGTVLASDASTTTGATGYMCISTVSLLASFWGCNSPMLTSGYRVFPINVKVVAISHATSDIGGNFGNQYVGWRTMAFSGSLIMLRFGYLSTRKMDNTQSAVVASTPKVASDSIAIKLYLTGFVISAPGT